MPFTTNDLERGREEFLSRMSHELRTPLNAVIGFSRVLESNRAGNQRPEDIEMLRRVRASGEQLLRLVEGMLDQRALRHGSLPLQHDETDVAQVASRVIEGYRIAALARGLRIRKSLPSHAAPMRLDATRLGQTVRHLVDNAVKFTRAGTIRVSLTLDRVSRRPRRLTVADTGIGIPADRMDRIFEPFEQIDPSRSREFGGLGLGLPLARQLCQAMGLGLSVASTVGKGSRFTIFFPSS